MVPLPPPKGLLVVLVHLPPPKGFALAPPPNGVAGLSATPNGFDLAAPPAPNAVGAPNGLAEGVGPKALAFPNAGLVDGAPNGLALVVEGAGAPNGEEPPPPNGDALGAAPNGDEVADGFPNGELDEACGAAAKGLLVVVAPPPPNGFWPNGEAVLPPPPNGLGDGFAGAPNGLDAAWLPNPPEAPPPNRFEAAPPPPNGDAVAPPLSGSPANSRLATYETKRMSGTNSGSCIYKRERELYLWVAKRCDHLLLLALHLATQALHALHVLRTGARGLDLSVRLPPQFLWAQISIHDVRQLPVKRSSVNQSLWISRLVLGVPLC